MVGSGDRENDVETVGFNFMDGGELFGNKKATVGNFMELIEAMHDFRGDSNIRNINRRWVEVGGWDLGVMLGISFWLSLNKKTP